MNDPRLARTTIVRLEMKLVLAFVLVVLVACGRKEGPPGPAPVLRGDAAEECWATVPRAIPCMDGLFVAYAGASLGGLADEASLRAAKHSDEDEARAIHLTACYGDRDFTYMQNIVACWNEHTCAAFAACVGKRTKPIE